MNSLPWVMTRLLADEHRRDLESTAARRRRPAITGSDRPDRTRYLRRHHRGL
jgi:hypothetical protein